jgi:hypothetical protein
MSIYTSYNELKGCPQPVRSKQKPTHELEFTSGLLGLGYRLNRSGQVYMKKDCFEACRVGQSDYYEISKNPEEEKLLLETMQDDSHSFTTEEVLNLISE